jgi:hypothetical protein
MMQRVRRQDMLRLVSERLDGRRLVWFGVRGEDVEGVADLAELSASYSVIAPHPRLPSVALEQLSGTRADLDLHHIDENPDPVVGKLRRMMLRELSDRTALFNYCPSAFVSALGFARRDRCRYLGLFSDHQAAFDHKPWVETEVAALGVPHVQWSYVSDEEKLDTLRLLRRGPVMLRSSRASGGVGLTRIDEPEQLAAAWPQQDEAYVSVSRYIPDAAPINVGAVIWRDGITMHPASFQLVGIQSLTPRRFGYCGNDFGAVRDLNPGQVDRIEHAVHRIGQWMRAHGYRGAFGADFLVPAGGEPLFTEVNPRFQGSTHASCQLSISEGESCILLDHLAALLGVDAPSSRTLGDLAASAGDFGSFVVHSPIAAPAHFDPSRLVDLFDAKPGVRRTDAVTSPELVTDPCATVARFTVDDRLTDTGYDLRREWDAAVREALPTMLESAVAAEPS